MSIASPSFSFFFSCARALALAVVDRTAVATGLASSFSLTLSAGG